MFCFCVTLCLWAFPPPVFILCYLAALNTTSATQTVHLLLSQGLPQLSISYVYVGTLDVSYPQIANDLQHCCPKKVAIKIRLNTNFFRGALIDIGAPFTKKKKIVFPQFNKE